jgi:LysM repeat protein
MEDYSRMLLGGFFSSIGLGSSSGPTKLKIKYETSRPKSYDGVITAQFNPTTISTSSSVTWKTVNMAATVNSRSFVLSFTSASIRPPTLTLELLFDGYEGAAKSSWGSLLTIPNPLALYGLSSPSGVSVLPETSEVAELTQINQELHRPPQCQVWWGPVLMITGPLTSLSQQFTRFLPDGAPVRAKLGCTFTVADSAGKELHSSDVDKTHTVRLGDTLQSIAARHYENPGKWRVIAKANDIDDPRALTPGSVLTIPRTR